MDKIKIPTDIANVLAAGHLVSYLSICAWLYSSCKTICNVFSYFSLK